MNKNERWLIYPFVFIAVICSIVAINHTCPRAEYLNFDYMGVIVGILSLLVTVLIGYNIVTIFDAKKELAYYNTKLEEYKSKLSKLENVLVIVERKSVNGIKTSFAIDMQTKAVLSLQQHDYVNATYYCIQALYNLLFDFENNSPDNFNSVFDTLKICVYEDDNMNIPRDLSDLPNKCYEYINFIKEADTYKYISNQFESIISKIYTNE